MAQSSRRQVRLSRSLGVALTPKAARYFEKRPYGPGQHGRAPVSYTHLTLPTTF